MSSACSFLLGRIHKKNSEKINRLATALAFYMISVLATTHHRNYICYAIQKNVQNKNDLILTVQRNATFRWVIECMLYFVQLFRQRIKNELKIEKCIKPCGFIDQRNFITMFSAFLNRAKNIFCFQV